MCNNNLVFEHVALFPLSYTNSLLCMQGTSLGSLEFFIWFNFFIFALRKPKGLMLLADVAFLFKSFPLCEKKKYCRCPG